MFFPPALCYQTGAAASTPSFASNSLSNHYKGEKLFLVRALSGFPSIFFSGLSPFQLSGLFVLIPPVVCKPLVRDVSLRRQH
jgi:hypothetical protein